MGHLDQIKILERIRAGQAVKVGKSEIQIKNLNDIRKTQTIVNTQKQTFSNNQSILKKSEPRIINNLTFDERPKTIIEENINIPFSQPRSAQQIIDHNLGIGFLTRPNVKTPEQKKTTESTPITPLDFTRSIFQFFGGLFK